MEAQEWCRKYMKSGNVKDLTQAWDLYYHVFRRISKQLPQVGSRGILGSSVHPDSLLLETYRKIIACSHLLKEQSIKLHFGFFGVAEI
jgi:hypothetical protein